MNLIEKYNSILVNFSKNKNILAIIIFGSYSNNSQNTLSDLDICIISKSNTSQKDLDYFLSFGTDELDISLFNNLPLPLQHKIMETGRIYFQNINLRKLKLNIRNQFIDFKPFLVKAYKKRGYPITI